MPKENLQFSITFVSSNNLQEMATGNLHKSVFVRRLRLVTTTPISVFYIRFCVRTFLPIQMSVYVCYCIATFECNHLQVSQVYILVPLSCHCTVFLIKCKTKYKAQAKVEISWWLEITH